MFTNCTCPDDCTYNKYSISQQENIMFERSAPMVHEFTFNGILGDTRYGHFGTNVMDGLDYDNTYWFNMGKRLKGNIYMIKQNLTYPQGSISRMWTRWCSPRTLFWITSSPGLSLSEVTAAASGRR